MHSAPFFRPMFAGFAITATAILVVPMSARAQPASATPRCEAPTPKPRRLKLGQLLSAAQSSGAMPLLGGAGRGLSLAGALAGTAVEAASRSRGDADRALAASACLSSGE